MYTIHSDVTDKLILDVTSNIKGRRFSRALWLDIEASESGHTLILRGLDRVLPDAGDSTAREAEDSHIQNALVAKASETGIFWTIAEFVKDATLKDDGYWRPRAFTLATFDDAEQAEQVCAELLAFYFDAVPSDESDGLPFSVRWAALTAPARELTAILISVFGSSPTKEMQKTASAMGSFADYLAGKAKKAKPVKLGRQSIEKIKADAQAEFIKQLLAKSANSPADQQAAIMAIIGQLQTA